MVEKSAPAVELCLTSWTLCPVTDMPDEVTSAFVFAAFVRVTLLFSLKHRFANAAFKTRRLLLFAARCFFSAAAVDRCRMLLAAVIRC